MTGDGPVTPVPRLAAGRIDRGADAEQVHLIERLGAGRWRTRCPAGGNRGRDLLPPVNASPTLAPIDCAGCLDCAGDLVRVVNVVVGEQLAELARAGNLVKAFLAWATLDTRLDDGGVVLAIYAGSTRLHPVTSAERNGLLARWLETRRKYP